MNKEDFIEKYGNQSESDNAFTKKARSLQSLVRFEMKEKPGIGPMQNSHDSLGNPTYYGNMLTNGEKSGKNFILSATFQYALKRVENKTKKETIDAYRLFNNMLSSMPMCFNLFHPLMLMKNTHPESLNNMINKAFKRWNISIENVDEIKIEFVSENYEDKSAMDAAIIFSSNGKKYLMAIETKYVEPLGSNKASNNEAKAKLAESLGIFTDSGIEYIKQGCTQIYRNFLLTEFVRQEQGFKDSYSVILSPSENKTSDSEILELKSYLKPEFHYKLIKYDLEDFLETIKEECPVGYKPWLNDFYNRYLNFERVDQLFKNVIEQK